MRPAILAAAGFLAAAACTSAGAQTPTTADIATPVPSVDSRTLSPSDVARRNALYGEGWQYRMAPISPGANAGVPINPGVGVKPTDLSNLDQRIKSDEVTMTGRRDSELARQDAVIAGVEPAMPWVWRGRQWPAFLKNINYPDFNFPDFHPAIDWVKNRF